MGRAKGTSSAVAATATRRHLRVIQGGKSTTPPAQPHEAALTAAAAERYRGAGIGAFTPTARGEAATKALIADVHRGEYEVALATLERTAGLAAEAPLVDELLVAVSETAAAQVRVRAEQQLQERLQARGVAVEFSYVERKQLRDEISAAITDRLLTSWRGGETVNAASLREFATEIASEIVSENVVAYSAAYEDERAHHNQL